MTGGGQRRGFFAGDALRGAALVSVLAYHVAASAVSDQGARPDRAIDALRSLGLFSVFVFFALSGYLLGRPYLRAAVLGEPTPAAVPYLRNRALRILPVYLLLLAGTLIVFGRAGSSWGEVAAHVGFGQLYRPSGFSELAPHTWSLANEAVFYLLLPLVLLPVAAALRGRGSVRSRALVISGGLFLGIAASLTWRSMHPHDPQLLQPPATAFAFLAGMLIAALEPVVRPRLTAGTPLWPLMAAAVAGFAVWVLAIRSMAVASLGAAVGCGAVVGAPLVQQWATGGTSRALDNRVLNWLGERAYSIYLWHVPIFLGIGAFVPEHGAGPALTAAAAVARVGLALAVGAVSYRLVEVPGFELRRRWHTSSR